MKPPFFFHVHIPKTAGSAFNEVCQRNFGPLFNMSYGMLNDYIYTREQLERAIAHHPNLRATASHRFSLDLPWDYERLDVRAISFVRHPGRRLLSLYFYNRHIEYSIWEPEAKALDVRPFFEGRIRRLAEGEGNEQLRQLTGRRDDSALEEVAARLDADRFLLFPSERFAESCLVLGKLFPDWFQNLRYDHFNVSRRDQETPDDLVAEYAEKSGPDARLHRLAEENLERLLQRLFEPAERAEALARFS